MPWRVNRRTARLIAVPLSCCVALALAIAGPRPAAAAASYAVAKTIPVSTSIFGAAVDPLTHHVLVGGLGGSDANKVAVIDEATGTVVGHVTVGTEPLAIAVDVTTSAPVLNGAAARPAISPPIALQQTSTIYVVNRGSSTVSIIDGATDAVTATVNLPAGGNPSDVAVDVSTQKVYIAERANGTVQVINAASHQLATPIAVGGIPASVAVDPTTHTLFVANNDPQINGIQVVNESTGAVTNTIQLAIPTSLAVDSTTHALYVLSESGLNGLLSKVDVGTGSVTGSVSLLGQPGALALDGNAHTLYATSINGNSVAVVAEAALTALTNVAVGSKPYTLALDSASHTAYVANDSDGTVSVLTRVSPVSRLAGADRFGTAVAVSKAEFPSGGAGAVVLARGDDYPDALVGAPLAAARNAPLLLTSGSSLPSATKAEVVRVLAAGGVVFVLGGTSAVPASVADELTGMGYQVTRYSGANRFATAVRVADALGDPGTVLLATGVNFPDALSAGVAAAKAGGVVLLTSGTTAPAETSAYLSAHPGTVYAVGGPAAAADPAATPLVGSDRYATSVAVAGVFFSAPALVGVATGLSFPDALSGGGLLGHSGAPLVLVSSGGVPSSVGTYLTGVKATVTKAYLFGGASTVTQAAQDAIDADLTS